ncbi:glycosyltransferase [bacterium]|nr:glycosyltransferase [bacterium]
MPEQSEPLVSIITPSFNQGKFIERTLLSVKDQVYSNIEHIVIDGGSTDNTLRILERYEGSYNLRWLSEPDRGMYQAINKGLAQAKGTILAYLNSDDLYLPWAITSAVEYFKVHPEVDMLYGDLVKLTENGELRLLFSPPFDPEYVRRVGFLPQPTVFWRYSLYNEIGGFKEELKFIADCDYWMRAAKDHKVGKTNEFLAVERDHPEAKRFTGTAELNRELISVRREHSAGGRVSGFLIEAWHRLKAFIAVRCLMTKFLFKYYTGYIKPGSCWSNILSRDAFRLTSLPKLLLTFAPGLSRKNPMKVKLTLDELMEKESL